VTAVHREHDAVRLFPGAESAAPKVSVCVITYNHERYIRQCLQSLVDQRADFAFEVIVGDDCSTDGTAVIVREFIEWYPTIVRGIFQPTNTLGITNNMDVHDAARGEYVAHVDGDDYALPGKLQRQADFLDAHKQSSFVCHRVQRISEDGSRILGVMPAGRQPTFTSIEALLHRYVFFVNSSKMYRRPAQPFDHRNAPPRIDFYSHVEHAASGPIGFIGDILGCYRITQGGITSATGAKLYTLFDYTIDAFERARELGVCDDVVDGGKAKYLVGAACLCLTRDDYDGFRRYIAASRLTRGQRSLWQSLVFGVRNHQRLARAIVGLKERALVTARRIQQRLPVAP
jgi:glycosyltransferase involved in cell wall biosynthesis